MGRSRWCIDTLCLSVPSQCCDWTTGHCGGSFNGGCDLCGNHGYTSENTLHNIFVSIIIPLIPGDLLYNTIVYFVLQDTEKILSNAAECGLALLGMSVGFVLISTFVYYKRIYYVAKSIMKYVLTHTEGGI